jgi:hypothetical protein
MGQQWYCARDKIKYGPFSSSQMGEFAATGWLLPIDIVQKEGIQKWVSASKVKGLFAEAQPTPDPVLPPILPLGKGCAPEIPTECLGGVVPAVAESPEGQTKRTPAQDFVSPQVAALEQLKEMLARGMLSTKEFDQRKAALKDWLPGLSV